MINKIKISNNDKLVSLDITNMFGNIPRTELIESLKRNKYNNNLNGLKYADIIEEIIKQNYCQFNNNFYEQTEGLAMGSPLPPILAEIYMNNFENNILNTSRYKQNVKLWCRYVDDILLIWNGTDRQLDQFFNETNNINEKIKFTIEKGNKTINFLDLTIQIDRNKLKYNIIENQPIQTQ